MSTEQPKKYKIRVGAPKVPDEVIDRHKNFPGLLDQHRKVVKDLYKKPLYKDPKTFLFVFLMAVIFYLVYLAFQEDKALEKQEKQKQELEESPKTAPSEEQSLFKFNDLN